MTKTFIAKRVVSVVVGIGTTAIVSSIIQSTTNPEKVTDKVAVTVSSWVLGSMAVDATRNYTDAKIDQIIAAWNAAVTK